MRTDHTGRNTSGRVDLPLVGLATFARQRGGPRLRQGRR